MTTYTATKRRPVLVLPNNKVLVSFKIDKQLKDNLSVFGDEIGISLSTMINSLLKKVERTKEFDLSLEESYMPRPSTIKRIEEVDKAYREGKLISMTSVDFGKYLKKLSE